MSITSPIPKSLEDLIRNKFYRIPLYQRPYDWDIDKVSQLWDDINSNEPGYFLGFLLFKPDPPNEPNPSEFEIVDGQQRLATLLLLIRAFIEILEENNAKGIADEFQKDYISQHRAGAKESRITLTLSKRDKDKFDSLLRGDNLPISKKLSSWKNLDNTIIFFKEKLLQLNQKKGQEGIINFVNDKVLKATFLDVRLGNDSDVYQFFETLNDRGMDLSIADLVKNHVCGVANKQKVPVEECAYNIDRISDELRSGKFKDFLLHYCWANAEDKEPIPRKKLMEWYSNKINKSGNIKNFLVNLERFALNFYINYVEPNRCTDSAKRNEFIYLDALDATRCYPLLLRAEDSLARKDFLRLCKAIEILTFRHSTILKWDAKTLENVFHGLIRDIIKEKSINSILEIIKKQDAMKSTTFKTAFEEFVPATHKLARYTLLKIEEHISGKAQVPLDWNGLTLEHILAEGLSWFGHDEYLERLGNLTLLSFPMNKDASNKPFKEKRDKTYIEEKRLKITKKLLNVPKFTKDTIISRQKQLANYAIEIWNFGNII